MAGTDRGVTRARSFKRLRERVTLGGKELLSKHVGAPWRLVPSDAAAEELLVTIRMNVALFVDAGELSASQSRR